MKNVPGPGHYNTLDRSLSYSSTYLWPGTTTFPKDKRGEIKVYEKEYEREYANKLGPGPGGYDPISSVHYLLNKS